MNLFDNISMDRFLESLKYIWQGMLCIFLVIGLIIVVVYALNTVSNKIAKRKEEKAKAELSDSQEQ